MVSDLQRTLMTKNAAMNELAEKSKSLKKVMQPRLAYKYAPKAGDGGNASSNITSQYGFGRKASNDEMSTGKMDANVYNRRSRSIAQGVAPPSGTTMGAAKLPGKHGSSKNASEIVIHNNQDGGSKARYGEKWSGTITRAGNEEEFNLAELNITQDGKMKGNGSDEAGEFKFEGIHGKGDVNCTQTYTSKKVIYYSGKINAELNELTGNWGMKPGEKDGEFRIFKV